MVSGEQVMSLHPQSHLSQTPDTLRDLFVVPPDYSPSFEPNIGRIVMAAEEGAEYLALVAAGEAGTITRDDVHQANTAEHRSLITTAGGDVNIWQARRQLLEGLINRHSEAAHALRIASLIYKRNYFADDEHQKPHIDHDKIIDLYDRTEQFEEDNPVLRLLIRIHEMHPDALVEDRRSVAERLVRIILSGGVDEQTKAQDEGTGEKTSDEKQTPVQ